MDPKRKGRTAEGLIILMILKGPTNLEVNLRDSTLRGSSFSLSFLHSLSAPVAESWSRMQVCLRLVSGGCTKQVRKIPHPGIVKLADELLGRWNTNLPLLAWEKRWLVNEGPLKRIQTGSGTRQRLMSILHPGQLMTQERGVR